MILCCGEAVIDMLPASLADGGAGIRPVAGGAALNCAIAMARLGVPVGFCGGLSQDQFGRMLALALTDAGVDLQRAATLNAPTMLAFVHPAGDTQSFSFYAEGSATQVLTVADLPSLDGVLALTFGGLSLIHRPAAGALEALMQMAGPERLIALDVNIRPSLIGAEEAAYRARLTRMLAMSDIIKLSDEDIDWLRPDPPKQLLAGRAALVLHTHGAGGATLYTRHGSLHVPAPAVDVIDTVGAGDTFLAGVLAALHDHGALDPGTLARAPESTLRAAVAYGVRAATLSTTRAGANPPTRQEMQK